ncbi:MAG: concanavalin A lectin, partial [Flavobacteriales bacterium]
GFWSPGINNTTTTTYSFTSAAGQCASNTQLIIIINNPVTPQFETFGPYCTGAPVPALPTTSTNGINGTWSAIINNATTTTYTFTPTVGQCAETITTIVVVNANPATSPINHE